MVQTASSVVIDTSALVAILHAESNFAGLLHAISECSVKIVGAPTLVEASMVLIGRKKVEPRELDRFIADMQISVVSFEINHWRAAEAAFLKFGKGRDPAGLNYGDCLSYAIAKVLDAPLLFVGQDFSQTDIRPALAPI
jgi:ribonuclease VapC